MERDMEHQSRYLLHRRSTCTGKCFACDHQPAIDEISKGQSMLAQLRAIVLPALETMADERMELVVELFGSIQDCSRKVRSELQCHYSGQMIGTDRRLIGNNSSDYKCSNEKKSKRGRGTNIYSTSYVTRIPHYDGHQWRKYGQKNIINSKHQRSYYKCTYKHEQNCEATKTVQQVENTSEPVMYTVVYYGQHTCKANTVPASPHVIETSIPPSAVSSDHIGDHKSLESMCTPQAYVCPDTTTGSDKTLENQHITPQGLLEIIGCAPLDSDSWEIDAIVKFGASSCYDDSAFC